jgi:hypothetical protein
MGAKKPTIWLLCGSRVSGDVLAGKTIRALVAAKAAREGTPPPITQPADAGFFMGAKKPTIWLLCGSRVSGDVLAGKTIRAPVAAQVAREGSLRP